MEIQHLESKMLQWRTEVSTQSEEEKPATWRIGDLLSHLFFLNKNRSVLLLSCLSVLEIWKVSANLKPRLNLHLIGRWGCSSCSCSLRFSTTKEQPSLKFLSLLPSGGLICRHESVMYRWSPESLMSNHIHAWCWCHQKRNRHETSDIQSPQRMKTTDFNYPGLFLWRHHEVDLCVFYWTTGLS